MNEANASAREKYVRVLFVNGRPETFMSPRLLGYQISTITRFAHENLKKNLFSLLLLKQTAYLLVADKKTFLFYCMRAPSCFIACVQTSNTACEKFQDQTLYRRTFSLNNET